MIVCGWCGAPTADADWCSACKHSWPRIPWEQRGQEVPGAIAQTRRRLDEARAAIEASGQRATVERVAEYLDVSARTVRRWQQMAD